MTYGAAILSQHATLLADSRHLAGGRPGPRLHVRGHQETAGGPRIRTATSAVCQVC